MKRSLSNLAGATIDLTTGDDYLLNPLHVAIIMDGNGRWARARGLPRTLGHRQGAEALRRSIEAAHELKIQHLTVFGFSSENWKRSSTEINDLMGLLRLYLAQEIDTIHSNGICLTVIGERERLPADILTMIEDAEARTKNNKKMKLTIALSYGGRSEIVRAARTLARRTKKGELEPDAIDEKEFENCLFTAGTPDPDIVIRTSGEKRLSNFLLWQCAYAEFIFIDKLWPDFDREDLKSAIAEYKNRQRRYGKAG